MEAEKVRLLATVHGPVEAVLLAELAAVVAGRFPESKAAAVDGEEDIVFVLPLGVAVEPAETSEPLHVVPDPEEPPAVDEDPAAEPLAPEPVVAMAAKPRVGDAAAGTSDSPVIYDPSYGDAETRARRLRAYLDELHLGELVPDDVEKAKDAHRRGTAWKDSQGRWHCPWCCEDWKMAAHAGRHRQGCRYRPGERLDRQRVASSG